VNNAVLPSAAKVGGGSTIRHQMKLSWQVRLRASCQVLVI
jgi:hypothetical protein